MKPLPLIIGDKKFYWRTRTFIMGILNITPDSFSGDGLFDQIAEESFPEDQLSSIIQSMAIEKGIEYLSAGVDIIDVGAESTRPGSDPVPIEQELNAVIPVVKALANELDVVISIDTYKAEVARAAIEAGALLVNDVWALRADKGMADVIADYKVPVVLMHNRSSWVHADIRDRLGGRYVGMEYHNLIEDIKQELLESVAIAHHAGITDQQIIIDPGIGFGKTVEQNLELIDRLDEFCDLGYPVLFGPSRKSFIGYTLDLPPAQRVEGTAAAVAIGIDRGADIVRVHDVSYMARVVRMTDAIVRKKSPASSSQ